MNGRIYDPLLGRFLSADLVVQNPRSLQCFNRYSYVMNNPLTLTDPSGFEALGEDFERYLREMNRPHAHAEFVRTPTYEEIMADKARRAQRDPFGSMCLSASQASEETTPEVRFRPPNRLGIVVDPNREDDDEDDSADGSGLLEDRNDGVETAEDSGGPTCTIAHDSKGEITEITAFVTAPSYLRNRTPEAKSAHEKGDYSDMQLPLADLSGSIIAFGVKKAADTAAAYGDDAAKVAGLSRASYALGKASPVFSGVVAAVGLIEGGGGPREVVQTTISGAIIGFSVLPPPMPLISIGLGAANLFLGDYFYRQIDEDW